MTIKQLRAEQAKVRLAKKRERSKARKARKAEGVQRRKARTAVRMAPKHRLREWSERVRERDGNKCVVCGKGPPEVQIQAHHILPKERYQMLKFKRINGLSLCSLHHKWDKLSAHRNPIWFVLWLKENRPVQYQWAVDHLNG